MQGANEWPAFQVDAANRGYHPTAAAPDSDVELCWTFGPENLIFSQPQIVDGTLYVSDSDGFFFALNPTTGDEYWRAVDDGVITKGPAIIHDTVYVGSGLFSEWTIGDKRDETGAVSRDSLRAFDTETGAQVDSADFDCVFTSIWPVQNSLIFGTSGPNILGGGAVHRVGIDSLRPQWTSEFEASVFTAAFGDDILFVGDNQSTVTALDVATGERLWRTHCNFGDELSTGISLQRLVISEDIVLAARSDGKIYALDPETGSIMWMVCYSPIDDAAVSVVEPPIDPDQAAFMRGVFGPPAVGNETAYISGGPDDIGCVAIDVRTGNVKWTCECSGDFMSPAPTVVDGLVFVGNSDDPAIVTAIDANEGRVEWSYTFDEAVVEDGKIAGIDTPPVVIDERMYVGVRGLGLAALEGV